jgi:hypothetical protein
MRRYPLLRIVEWVKGNRVRLFFSTGRVVEVGLPVKSAKKARIVDYGMGLDPGDGLEFSAPDLYQRRGIELCPADWVRRPRTLKALNASVRKLPHEVVIAGEGVSRQVLDELARPRKRSR